MQPVLCVRWMERGETGFVIGEHWCAVKAGERTQPENYMGVKTICDRTIGMPWGYDQRLPDCKECLRILEKK